MNKKADGLASDYLQNASNFLWAAGHLNIVAPQQTADGMFKAENPIYFLLGHSAELLLKAVLAKNGIPLTSLRGMEGHDLEDLLSKVRGYGISINELFITGVETISENYKNHDHRYARSFGGFSIEDHEKWLKGTLSEKEKKEYGLVVKSGLNINQFINGLKAQLVITVEYLENKSKAA